MSTDAPTEDRLRQIAILVSIVDSVAARQLLAHLSPATARRVLEISRQLGPVTAEEQQQILTAFQQSASAGNDRTHQHQDSAFNHNSQPSPAGIVSTDPVDDDKRTESGPSASEPKSSPWAKLEKQVLLRFLLGERPNVIAVVISQLDTRTSVEILQDLGVELSCQVLQCLATLGSIDPEAKAAIEEHLAERFGQGEEEIRSENENARRIESLLMEAPVELRNQWRLVMGLDAPRESVGSGESAELAQAEFADTTGQRRIIDDELKRTTRENELTQVASTVTQADSHEELNRDVVQASRVNEQVNEQSVQIARPESEPLPDVLSLDQADQAHADELAQSVIQLEFERLLDLPQQVLAQVLSSAGTRSVLLALSGATPLFTKRLYRMLHRRDRQALDKRIKQLEAVSQQDVDQAQQKLIAVANSILREQAESHQPVRHAA